LIFTLLSVRINYAQYSIPWSSTVNVTFGKGSLNPAPPLSTGYTEYTYTTEACPPVGSYTILNKQLCPQLSSFVDAGHIYLGPKALPGDDSGYVMMVRHMASDKPKILFADTVNNLCSTSYLFWAGIMNVSTSTCIYPNFTLSAETLSGQVLGSFQTGDIGGANDKWAWYPGFYDAFKRPEFTFYGGVFDLPPGITDIIVKIIANTSTQNYCDYTCIVDNILLNPVGPEIKIYPRGNPDAWVTGSCFDGKKPVELTGTVGSYYHNFGNSGYTNSAFINSAYQWQQSTDNGYTWSDIPGANDINLSYNFYIADTFFVRLRVSEAANIDNAHCSVLSNIVRVEVDGFPGDFNVTSNSPVCTDGDVIFNLEGGASYSMTGPNGFYDNSAFPHIYNPTYNDTGWYYASLFTFGGCEVKDSAHVLVIGPDLKTGPDQSICYGETVQLSASGGETYSWSPATGLSATKVSRPYATPLATTKYQVNVSDQSGCGAQAYVTVNLKNGPLKAQISGPAIVCPDDIALFKDSSLGNIVSWRWSFGNGSTSNSNNPPPQVYNGFVSQVHIPVSLTVTDSVGCSSTSAMTVKAVGNCHIEVPSAFTPNGDGKNDYLYPLNAYNTINLLFRIYNRNGQLIFETKDWTRKWDGTVNGNLQSMSTYVWTLEYTDIKTGEHVYKKGTAVLIQ
jgi:gliding motility-associated-like protein